MSFGKSKTKVAQVDASIVNTDNRVAESGSVLGGNLSISPVNSSGDVNVTQTDLGAIRGALDTVGETLAFARSTQEANANLAAQSVTAGAALANNARQSETSGAINNFLKYGAIVAGIAFLAWAYKSR
jgi:hypothetical protein